LKGRVKKLLITLSEGGCCRKFSYPSPFKGEARRGRGYKEGI